MAPYKIVLKPRDLAQHSVNSGGRLLGCTAQSGAGDSVYGVSGRRPSM